MQEQHQMRQDNRMGLVGGSLLGEWGGNMKRYGVNIVVLHFVCVCMNLSKEQ